LTTNAPLICAEESPRHAVVPRQEQPQGEMVRAISPPFLRDFLRKSAAVFQRKIAPKCAEFCGKCGFKVPFSVQFAPKCTGKRG
jgi:hypothetical protein